jgi:hypothetical protein
MSWFPKSKGGMAVAFVTGICGVAFSPVAYYMIFKPKLDVEKPLPRGMNTRGARRACQLVPPGRGTPRRRDQGLPDSVTTATRTSQQVSRCCD